MKTVNDDDDEDDDEMHPNRRPETESRPKFNQTQPHI